jgi:hypothetical protein
MKESGMVRACSMHRRDEKFTQNFERKSWRRPRRRWEIILEQILRKHGGKTWTGCMWLKIGTSGGFL